jgi:hypothetical protein
MSVHYKTVYKLCTKPIFVKTNKAKIIQNLNLNIQPYTRLIQVDKPHWIILFSVGSNQNNTVRWYHDGDTITSERFSALSNASATNTSTLAWTVSGTGPQYTYVLFDTQVHTTEASNEKSINKYGVIESSLDASFITENETMDKYLNGLLHYTSLPKRTYDINTVTIPDVLLFPGQSIKIQDTLSQLNPQDDVTAEIIEVDYSFDASKLGVGTNQVTIRPIGYVGLADYDDKVPPEIKIEVVTPPPPFPIDVGSYFHFNYKILTKQTTPPPPPTPPPPGPPGSPPPPPPGPPPPPPIPKDKFGIKMLYSTTSNVVGGIKGREWFSNWNNGKFRTLSRFGERDPYDTELSLRGNRVLEIDGRGTLEMEGESSRIYVYDTLMQKRWLNVEITFYAKRETESYFSSMQGFTVGSRSNHQSIADCPCNGLTYYASAKYDGRLHFFKEIVHGNSYGTSEQPQTICVTKNWWNPCHFIENGYYTDIYDNWDGIHVRHHWLGYKFIIRTQTASQTVQLQMWRDFADGLNGGTWRKEVQYVNAEG